MWVSVGWGSDAALVPVAARAGGSDLSCERPSSSSVGSNHLRRWAQAPGGCARESVALSCSIESHCPAPRGLLREVSSKAWQTPPLSAEAAIIQPTHQKNEDGYSMADYG